MACVCSAAMPANERKHYLDATCDDDAPLRRRLERLLASHDSEGFMDVPLSPEILAEFERLKPEDAGFAGEIYNADEGKIYQVSLERESDAELNVQGCMLKVLCGSQTWTRVPDVNQQAAAAPVEAPAKKTAKAAPAKAPAAPAQ